MSMQPFVAVSIVDPPNVEPALAFSVTTLHGKQVGEVLTLAVARKLIGELQGALDAIERNRRART